MLIQEGVKPSQQSERRLLCLRALLIQEGVKRLTYFSTYLSSLRALLIQEGVKPAIINPSKILV